LNSREEISSTEKLLNVIRGQESADQEVDQQKIHAPGPVPAKRSKEKKSRGSGKSVNVGISIGSEGVAMVKATQLSERRWKILGHRIVSLPVGIGVADAPFADFLNSVLSDFVGFAKPEIWASISSLSVDIRRILIPKVARKQVSEAVFWTFKKKSPFNEAQMVFDFEVEDEVREKGAPKIAVTAYTADKQEIFQTRKLFEKAGFPLTGMTSPPFFVQNLFRASWLPQSTEAMAVLHVGDERSRIDIFSGQNLILTRGIKAGILSMAESLMEGYNDKWRISALKMAKQETEEFGPEITLEIPVDDGLPEKYGEDQSGQIDFEPSLDDPLSMSGAREPQSLDLELARRILLAETGQGRPLEPEDPGYSLAAVEVFEFTFSAVERLVRQLERTLAHYHNIAGNQRVTKIYISGVLNSHKTFVKYMGDQLGIEGKPLDPWGPALPFLENMEPPETPAQRAMCSPALSLALSSNERTPNLLYTHEQREDQDWVIRINRIIVATFLALIIPVFFFYMWEERIVDKRQEKLVVLKNELSLFDPLLDSGKLTVTASRVSGINKNIISVSKRFTGLAALNELARITPKNIRLLGVNADFEMPEPQKNQGRSNSEKEQITSVGFVIEGVVLGQRALMESSLATYVMRLENSLLFENPLIHKAEIEAFSDRGDALHFFLKLKVA